jgi:drug/metabolite transporter (DMT)-like permease
MFTVNLALLVPVVGTIYYPQFGLTPTSVGAFAVGGILGSLLARFYLFVGIERLGASRTEPLKSLFPLVALVAAVVLLGETLSARLVVGTLVLLAGVVGVTWESRNNAGTLSGRALWIAMGFPLAAAVLLGIDPVFTRIGLSEGTPPLVGTTVRVAAAAGGFLVYLGWKRFRGTQLEAFALNRWILAASLCNTLYLAAYLIALGLAPISVVAPILGATPLIVVLGGAVLTPGLERVTPKLVVSVVVVVVGVILVVSG